MNLHSKGMSAGGWLRYTHAVKESSGNGLGFLVQALVIMCVMATAAHCQTPTPVAPDCTIPFTLTAAGNSNNFDNRGVGCTNWVITYNSTGFTVLAIEFQSSATTTTAPAAFVAFAGTVTSGINPNTDIAQNSSTFNGYYPWLRVNLSNLTGTGTVRGVAYGWRTAAARGGGSTPGGAAAGCLAGTYPAPTIAGITVAGGVVFASGSPVCLAEDVANFYWDNVNKRLGLGAGSTPVARLEVSDTASAVTRGMANSQYSTDAAGASFQFYKARGTRALPTIIANNDAVGDFRFQAYDGANFVQAARIVVGMTGTIAATRVPARFRFFTSSDAAPSVTVENLDLFPGGNVGVRTTTDNGVDALQVTGSTIASLYRTTANCTTTASPGVCAAASAGAFTIAAAGTTITINTSIVTANSEINVMQNDGLGTRLGVTCYTAANTTPRVTAIVAGVSFDVTVTAPAVNPGCYTFSIVN